MIVFTVRGVGRFPIDMLRYDSCWPTTAVDGSHLEATFDRRRGERKEIELTTISIHGPTIARWKSFMWRVITQDGVKL